MSGNLTRKTGGPSVKPGRTGAGWNRCRATVIARANGRCALCGGALDPTAKHPDPRAIEVDHIVPLWKLERDLPPSEFARRANDPDGCRACHRHCHESLSPSRKRGSTPLAERERCCPSRKVPPADYRNDNWVHAKCGHVAGSRNWSNPAGDRLESEEIIHFSTWKSRNGGL